MPLNFIVDKYGEICHIERSEAPKSPACFPAKENQQAGLSVCVERLTSAERINAVVNDPSIYPHVRGAVDGYLDLTAVVADDRNVALFGEHGGLLFAYHQAGIYEAHTQVLPSGRGRWAVEMTNAALLWMFTKTDAVEVITRIPKGNIAARALAKCVHLEFELTNKNGWVRDGQPVPADWFSIPIQRWMATAPSLAAKGAWFHERLEREYERIGKTEDVHEDDALHDQMVGAAFEMVVGGQMQKAEHYYNRWASMAGYAPIRILSEKPKLVDIQDAVLAISGDNFTVIKCQ